MRAAVAERPDGADGLVVREVPRPEPRQGWALVRVEAFGLNRSEYMTLRGWSGAEVAFPRILGIECVGVEAEVAAGSAVEPGTTVAAVMGGMGRAFDGGYAEFALLPETQLMALETSLPWDVLGALPETFITAAGSLETLAVGAGQTLLVRGGTSSVGLACLELARAAGLRIIATTRNEDKLPALRAAGRGRLGDRGRRLRRARPRGAARGRRRRRRRPDRRARRARLARSRAARRHGVQLGHARRRVGDRRFRALDDIPSGRKLTAYHSSEAADASIGGPLLRAVVEQVERGAVDPGIDTVYRLDEIARRPPPHGSRRRHRQARRRPGTPVTRRVD